MEIDEAEIADLYRRYGHSLFRRCHALIRNDADAHELVQEAFCQFWKGRKKFEGRSSAFTYLYRIATNLSIDRLRRKKGKESVEFYEDRQGTDEYAPDRQAAALSDLVELTEGLDPDVLTTAVLIHVDGLTQDETAEALEVSRRTVGKRLNRFDAHTSKRARRIGRAPPLSPQPGAPHRKGEHERSNP